MVDITKQIFQHGSPDNLAYEIWTAEVAALGTEVDITPTYLKSVEFVTLTPAEAIAANKSTGYLKSTFVPGEEATVTIVADAGAIFLVKLEGKIA
jgi:hypothetical protein